MLLELDEFQRRFEEIVGNTPLIKISDKIYSKLETYNPSGSIKDRLIYHLIRDALVSDHLNKETVLVEATSGNTGISLAMFGAAIGLPVTLIMPRNMSPERMEMMRAYGANILTVHDSDFAAAISLRDKMCNSDDRYWSPMQFENIENIRCHTQYTAHELHKQLGSQGLMWGAFVSGAGTGGTMAGIKRYIDRMGLTTQTCLMLPYESSHNHGIQGVNDGGDFLLERSLMDAEIKVKTQDAIDRAKRLASESGLLVGISSGANIVAAERYVQMYPLDGVVTTMLCDRGERYLSIFNNS